MNYIELLATFVLSGGISTILTLRYSRRKEKLEMTDKAVTFWESQFATISEKYTVLEAKYDELKILIEDRAPLICYNAPGCNKRKHKK